MAGQKFNQERIQHCVNLLDALAQSGQSPKAYAQAQGLSYNQVRGWLTHGPRWRAELAGTPYHAPPRRPQTPVSTPVSAPEFVQLHPHAAHDPKRGPNTNPNAPAPLNHPSVHILCTQGPRSATLHWPTDAPLQCAQWLKAFLA